MYAIRSYYGNTSAPIGGNYWFTPSENGWSELHDDINGDGFCEEQYNLTIDLLNVDYLPLALHSEDIVAPEITINSPLNGTSYNTNTVLVNVTVFDVNVDFVTAEIKNGSIIPLTLNGNYYTGITPALSDGTYEIMVTANDTAGNTANETAVITSYSIHYTKLYECSIWKVYSPPNI